MKVRTDRGRRIRRAAWLLFALIAAMALRVAPGADDNWRGAGVMAGGKGYAATPMGQVHYRDIGPKSAKVPLLLVHQAWMSLIEFAEIQDELAKLGIRSIAVDTPGYGMSDPAPGQPSIRDLADNLVPVLDDLHVRRVIIVGHHTGSLIAASFAAHHPDRVVAVILHGSPYFTKAESEAALAQGNYDRTLQEDGSHFTIRCACTENCARPAWRLLCRSLRVSRTHSINSTTALRKRNRHSPRSASSLTGIWPSSEEP
jgi:pimeloyl-ACP methyl ester carboxylesterase